MRWVHCLLIPLVASADHIGVHHKRGENAKPLLAVVETPLVANCSVSVCEGPLAPIYCHGELIATAWQFGVQDWCPGTKLRFPPADVLHNFQRLKYPLKLEDFTGFCEHNFENTTYLEEVVLPDWKPLPETITRISDDKYRTLALKVHNRWPSLARRFNADVAARPHLYPVLPVPHPFIVPGGFFQVYFYWDSYWIIKGLLVSEMTTTVRGMLLNFQHIVDTRGFIPNSGNIQLSRRSQPPLFVQMVSDYFYHTGDTETLVTLLPSMEKELLFWRSNRTEKTNSHTVFLYKAISDCPRPENYLVDYWQGMNSTRKSTEVWRSIASACESGWDFSSRWFDHDGSRAFTKNAIRTTSIVPVDLNVIMLLNYRTMLTLCDRVACTFDYRALERDLSAALRDVLQTDSGYALDFDLERNAPRQQFYASNLFSLLVSQPETIDKEKVLDYLNATEVLDFPAGLPTTLPVPSREQWDFPNVWAPNQHLAVASLRQAGMPLWREQARKFVDTVYNGFVAPAKGAAAGLWEKYDARRGDGSPGKGGEYKVQEGFGWTNGAVLDLIVMLQATSPHLRTNQQLQGFFGSGIHSLIVTGLLAACFLLILWFIACGVSSRRACSLGKPTIPRRDRGSTRRLLDEDSEHSD